MALMDLIKQKRQAQPAPTSAADIARLQQVRATGKAAVGGGGPAMSNLAAQQAQVEGQAQAAQIDTQAAIQQQALGAAETQQSHFSYGRRFW